VISTIESAKSGILAEGNVSRYRHSLFFGWKGSIGTASRKLPESLGGHTVGVLVQTNLGVKSAKLLSTSRKLGVLSKMHLRTRWSCMIVIATDAPVLDRI
jgi:D-aminopeptidase